jgi:hypothetical protein
MEKNSKKNKKNKNLNYIYLGVDFNKTEKNNLKQEIIKNYIYDLIKNYPEELSFKDLPFYFEEDSEKELNNNKKENKIWKNPNSIHITTLFIGNKGYIKNNNILNNFKEDEEVKVNILGLIIIPYKIAICIVKIDIFCDNEFPHITLSIGDYKPKNSNDVLDILFGKNGKYKDLYFNIINGNDVDFIIKDCVNIFGHDENVYIKLKNYGFSLIGFQKGFY